MRNMDGAKKVAKRVPINCVAYWSRGDVPRRYPTRKSPMRSVGIVSG